MKFPGRTNAGIHRQECKDIFSHGIDQDAVMFVIFYDITCFSGEPGEGGGKFLVFIL